MNKFCEDFLKPLYPFVQPRKPNWTWDRTIDVALSNVDTLVNKRFFRDSLFCSVIDLVVVIDGPPFGELAIDLFDTQIVRIPDGGCAPDCTGDCLNRMYNGNVISTLIDYIKEYPNASLRIAWICTKNENENDMASTGVNVTAHNQNEIYLEFKRPD